VPVCIHHLQHATPQTWRIGTGTFTVWDVVLNEGKIIVVWSLSPNLSGRIFPAFPGPFIMDRLEAVLMDSAMTKAKGGQNPSFIIGESNLSSPDSITLPIYGDPNGPRNSASQRIFRKIAISLRGALDLNK
jgi:hypothetical protein